MAVEPKRSCGYRKVGGLYLVAGAPGMPCHRLPMNIHVCPICNTGLKYSRGYTNIEADKFFGTCQEHGEYCHTHECKVCIPPSGKQGLLWIGGKFYTPASFNEESQRLGISKRISTVPRDFVLGETWIYLAHLKAGTEKVSNPDGDSLELFAEKAVPAVFQVFKPTRIEKILTESQAKDAQEMEALAKRGITPVIVPDDDKDHQGTVYDNEDE